MCPSCWNADSIDASFVTSMVTPEAPSPSRLTAFSTLAALLEATITFACSFSASSATAKPMPEVPPTMTTCFVLRLMVTLLRSFQQRARCGRLGGVIEDESAILERAEPDHLLVARIVLRIDPRFAIALLRKAVHHARHVAGREIADPGPRGHILIRLAQPRRHLARALRIHVVDQATDILARQIGAQRPRRVDVAECGHQIGHTGVHHALVGPGLGEVDRRAVNGKLHLTEHDKIQSGCRDDDVGFEFLA